MPAYWLDFLLRLKAGMLMMKYAALAGRRRSLLRMTPFTTFLTVLKYFVNLISMDVSLRSSLGDEASLFQAGRVDSSPPLLVVEEQRQRKLPAFSRLYISNVAPKDSITTHLLE